MNNSMEPGCVKTKRLAFVLLLSLFVATVGISYSPQLFTDSSNEPKRLMTISQLDEPITITTNAELAQQSSSGVGTRSDPYIIEGKRINALYCLTIQNTTAFFIIRDSEFIYYPPGRGGIHVVRFINVQHGTIEDCYVRGGEVGISLSNSNDCTIINCITFEAYDGILIDSSDNCTVVDCNSFGNTIGAMLVNSDLCNIINNSLYSNTERGVHIEVLCEDNIIAGNQIGWNRNLNAIDNGVNTAFDDGIVFGNAWSDYNASEEYIIPGSGDSTDSFASRLIDTTAPIVVGLYDTVVDVESSEKTITWTASDTFNHQYQLSINDEITETGIWDGRSITISFNDLAVGTYDFILYVIDGAGNVGTDAVTVSVVSFILGGIGTELVMLASGVTVVSFIVIILIIKRFP